MLWQSPGCPHTPAAVTQQMHNQHPSMPAQSLGHSPHAYACTEIPAHCQAACKPALTWAEAEHDQEQFSPCVFCMFVINCALMPNISVQVLFSPARGIPMYLSLGRKRILLLRSIFYYFLFPFQLTGRNATLRK